jgi:hypothetical protein
VNPPLAPYHVTVASLQMSSVWCRRHLSVEASAHASHNLLIQNVFDPLTTDTGLTKYITGEFGVALALISLSIAYVFWKKRAKLN